MVAGSPRTWATNEYITATRMNREIRDQLFGKSGAPRCYLWKSVKVGYPISNGTADIHLGWDRSTRAVHLDQTLYDFSFDGSKMSLGDGRIFISHAGVYRFNGAITLGKYRKAAQPSSVDPDPQTGTRGLWVGRNMNGNFQTDPNIAGIDTVFGTQLEFFGQLHSSMNTHAPSVTRVRGSMYCNRGDHIQLFYRSDGIALDTVSSQGTVFLQGRWVGA